MNSLVMRGGPIGGQLFKQFLYFRFLSVSEIITMTRNSRSKCSSNNSNNSIAMVIIS